jgi:uncharacterized membrane protein (Fun14 family)
MVQNKPDAVEAAIEKLKPILSKLSFGAIMGYTSGYATKKVGKVAAFVVGAGFIFLQSLAVAGYIEIDWMKIKDSAIKKCDTVSVSQSDVQIIYHFLFSDPTSTNIHSRFAFFSYTGW